MTMELNAKYKHTIKGDRGITKEMNDEKMTNKKLCKMQKYARIIYGNMLFSDDSNQKWFGDYTTSLCTVF